MKKVGILGSTGSIGRQTLEVIERFPDQFQLVAIAGGSNLTLLAEQANIFNPKIVSVANEADVELFRTMLFSDQTEVMAGEAGLVAVATFAEVDILVTSVTGTLGLLPTVEAIKAGKDIALANKETLVAAGELVMNLAKEKGVNILPVDSEHSALFQCLNGEPRKSINKLILTASGGPFRGKDKEYLETVDLSMALNHPKWSMGKKISVDSATLMNKGLEVLEAKWLYDQELSKIEVVVHPQSIIHSMVEYMDGSIIAQLGLPDMRIPIQYALTYPERWENNFPKLNFFEHRDLTFEEPDLETFSCLRLAYEAGNIGGTMPAVLNGANEQAVALFLEQKIAFLEIASVIEKVMDQHKVVQKPTLEDILRADKWARKQVDRSINLS